VLVLPEDDSALCIGQASHAWISGQMARAWAEPFDHHEDICLAAEQHDVGMAEWDRAPALNKETGLPYAFTEMPFEMHSGLWLGAPKKLVTTSVRAAALVSMHGTKLYELRKPTSEVGDYLRRQEEFRRGLGFAREDLAPASTLVWIWDYLSLALILGWEGEVEGVAVKGGRVSPWPFRDPTATFLCEGRRLRGRFSDEGEMQAALAAAPVEALVFELSA
jgi:hypothetical protein